MSVRVPGFKSDMATLMEIAWALMGDRMVADGEAPEVRIKSSPYGAGWSCDVTLSFKEEILWSCPIWINSRSHNHDFDVLEHAVKMFSEYVDKLSSIPGVLVPKVMES